MNVSLTQQLEKFVQKKVASGLYTSASEVVREGLRLLEEQERLKEARLQEFREKVEVGWTAAERGEFVDGSAAMKALLARTTKKAKAKKKSA
ncbi:MAG: type II toxin-antitoxin system ParD family antitoxin [Candidatus Eisenbacteria bacterium]|nr:type II toxin-antitoxin system ParD family antitoxin [Candidatus Eisenbacteria bacterium]